MSLIINKTFDSTISLFISYAVLLKAHYILHTSSTDKLQASHLFVASLGSMFLALITAFIDLEKTKKAELKEELLNEDLGSNDSI